MIIINELSLNGQFDTIGSLKSHLTDSLKIMEILSSLKIPLYKNMSFFDCLVLKDCTLHTLLNEYKSDDDFRAFKNKLIKFPGPPYWEDIQRHSCHDVYDCAYTEKKCEYGLAEAVENNQVVFSFSHAAFLMSTISVQKNKSEVSIFNISSMNGFREILINLIKNQKIILNHEQAPFTFSSANQLLLKYYNYADQVKNKSQNDKISIYESWAELIGLINGWDYSTKLTKANNRSTYIKLIGGIKCNLEVDTEKGCFEIYYNASHKGEYNFSGDHFTSGLSTRQTNSW